MESKKRILTFDEVEKLIRSGKIEDVSIVMPTITHPLTKVCRANYFLDNIIENGFMFTTIFLHSNINNILTNDDMVKSDPSVDLPLSIDKNSFRLNSWINNQKNHLICVANVEKHQDLYPRAILLEAIRKIKEKHNITFKAASELEFYTMKNTVDEIIKDYPEVNLDKHRMNNRYSDFCSGVINDRSESLRKKVKDKLEECGIRVEAMFSEHGPGMQEINIKYQEVLLNCDNHIMLKQCIKKVLYDEGQSVSFMAKTFIGQDGSSCHFHISAYDSVSGESYFALSDDQEENITVDGLTIRKNMYYFIGGLLKYVLDLFLLYAPTINSYKRYKKYSCAPLSINSWSVESRFSNVRIVGKGKDMRIEFRAPGADAMPYLALSAIMYSGMKGVEDKIVPNPIDKGDIYNGIKDYHKFPPNNIYESALVFKKSEFVTEVFGDNFKQMMLNYAFREWEDFSNHISNYEINRYLELV